MKRPRGATRLIPLGAALFLAACSTTLPKELADARTVYKRVSTGTTTQLAPAELHTAANVLQQAEQSYKAEGDSQRTRDLAYIAQRKLETAEAQAAIQSHLSAQKLANKEMQQGQAQAMQQTREQLSSTRSQLAESERNRQSAELKAKEALANLAAVKEEERGLVITLSGSVLFPSNQATLLPEAQTRLNQVAEALMANKERTLVIEGHTDSRGSNTHNQDLSQRRAQAVREYLASRGYDASKIQAVGVGEERPVASNKSAEGRANNRRVEIIVPPSKKEQHGTFAPPSSQPEPETKP